ncbi:MAG: hypothetical protein AAFQ22_11830 [Pseudomonadota bacterium]
MADDRTIPEAGIVDRYSGREADEFSVDDKLSLEDRVWRFEGAEIELMRAEAHLERGADKTDIYGEFHEIKDAIALLKRSAEHHANGFTREELAQAVEDKSIRVEILHAIADRRTIDARPRIPDGLSERLRAADDGRANEPDRDIDRDKER